MRSAERTILPGPGQAVGIPRRSFLKGLGLGAGGLALGFIARRAGAAPDTAAIGFAPNAFVHVAPDGTVTIVCHRSEMGQGIRSTLPALIADELGADPARIKVVQADGDVRYGDQDTDGSMSIRGFYDDLRRLGAVARVMLVSAAARRWRVPELACAARDGQVVHEPSRRALGFGALAADAAKLRVPDAKTVPLRPQAELRHMGKRLPAVDGPDIVHGRAVYGADVRLPGMLIAVVARPPVVGGKVRSYDARRSLTVPGVRRVVELPAPSGPPWGYQPLGGIAVLATNTWAALRGRAALDITWDHGPNADYDTGRFRDELAATASQPAKVVRDLGDAPAALAASARRLAADYFVPHLAHAPMEPPAAIAHIIADPAGDRCEVWTPSQTPQDTRKEVARTLGWDEKRVTVYVTLLGGAFGRKAKPDYECEAAFLAHAAGAPVRVQWMREDDLRHGYYHTITAQHLEAGFDGDGRMTAWLHRSVFPSISSLFLPAPVTHGTDNELQLGLTDVPVAAANVRGENGAALAHARIGWVRSVNNISHAFALCSFLDEIAHARGQDPRDALLDLYGPARVLATPAALGVKEAVNYHQPLAERPIDVGRLRRVIERVTEMAPWATRRADGRALGLAAHRSFLSYVAVVVSLARDPRGRLRVDEAWLAADAGLVLNPDRVHAQMEGSVIFGISLALYGEISMRGGAVEQSNFRDYRLVRMNEAPRRIHVDVMPSDAPPGGAGEPGLPPVAPAIANALFALTGKRVRALPLTRGGMV